MLGIRIKNILQFISSCSRDSSHPKNVTSAIIYLSPSHSKLYMEHKILF